MTSVVTRKFEELIKVQEEHSKKMASENEMLRSKLAVLMKISKQKVASSNAVPLEAGEGNREPLMFHGTDLMTVDASHGPSAFGRAIGAVMFGTGEESALINLRVGSKINKSGARIPCSADDDRLFHEAVERNFPCDKEGALYKAWAGANQYGAEMSQKYPHKRDKDNSEPIQ